MTHDTGRHDHVSNVKGWAREVRSTTAPTQESQRGVSPAEHACYMLMLHELLLRNMTNPGVSDLRGQEVVLVEWASWTGMTFHNLPAIALGGDEKIGRAFLVKECRDFVEYAARSPVPATWHPDHPESGRGIGLRWQSLCEHAAHLADMSAEYGVPAMTATYRLPTLPEIPRLGLLVKLLPASLRTFLREYAKVRHFMPDGPLPRHAWTRWPSDENR